MLFRHSVLQIISHFSVNLADLLAFWNEHRLTVTLPILLKVYNF